MAHAFTPPQPHGRGSAGTDAPSNKGQPWTAAEHRGFLDGLAHLGKGNWRGISRQYVTSRTPTQVASHAQKHFMRVQGVSKRRSRFSHTSPPPAEVPTVLARSAPSSSDVTSSSDGGHNQHFNNVSDADPCVSSGPEGSHSFGSSMQQQPPAHGVPTLPFPQCLMYALPGACVPFPYAGLTKPGMQQVPYSGMLQGMPTALAHFLAQATAVAYVSSMQQQQHQHSTSQQNAGYGSPYTAAHSTGVTWGSGSFGASSSCAAALPAGVCKPEATHAAAVLGTRVPPPFQHDTVSSPDGSSMVEERQRPRLQVSLHSAFRPLHSICA